MLGFARAAYRHLKKGAAPTQRQQTTALTPSAMRKCSPRLSVLSMTKFRKALMFSGRVMSPSPSMPPSPGKIQENTSHLLNMA